MTARRLRRLRALPASTRNLSSPYMSRIPESLAINMARAGTRQLGKAASCMARPARSGQKTEVSRARPPIWSRPFPRSRNTGSPTLGGHLEAQTHLLGSFFDMWSRTLHRMAGGGRGGPGHLQRNDKRFADEDWVKNPVFRLHRQAYFVTLDWAEPMVKTPRALTSYPHKAAFYVRKIASALSRPTSSRPTRSSIAKRWLRAAQSRERHADVGGRHSPPGAASFGSARRTPASSPSREHRDHSGQGDRAARCLPGAAIRGEHPRRAEGGRCSCCPRP